MANQQKYTAFDYSRGTFVGTKDEVMDYMHMTEEYQFEVAKQNGWINEF